MTGLQRSRRTVITGASGGRSLARVLGMPGLPGEPISEVVAYDTIGDLPVRLAHIDTSGGTREIGNAGNVTILHVLWCADEATSSIAIDGQPPGPILPGDSVTLPAGTFAEIGAGIVAVTLRAPAVATPRVGPTHGLERFVGFNRGTLCARTSTVTVERWKITTPLTLTPVDALAVTNLHGPLAGAWRGGGDLIGRTESVIAPPSLGPVTFVPDGLGYALVVRPTYAVAP